MPLRVNTNILSINVQRIGKINNRNLAMRLERLSSGLKINRAVDDAAGLARLRREIGTEQGSGRAPATKRVLDALAARGKNPAMGFLGGLPWP